MFDALFPEFVPILKLHSGDSCIVLNHSESTVPI